MKIVKKISTLGTAWHCLGVLTLLVTLAAQAQQVLNITLGTATAGGGFEVYGKALTRAIGTIDPGLRVELRSTAGSAENLALLASDTIDLALVQGEAAHDAFTAAGGRESGLRVVAAMYPTPGMFVVRADSPYRCIDDLRGQAVAFGARGSGLVALARYVLDGIGLDMNKDFIPVLLDRAGDGPALLREGRVAALWGGGRGWPVFSAAMTTPGGGRFIAPDKEQIQRIRARHPFLQVQTLPADAFPGQTTAIESVGSWSLILARRTLPDDVVYRFCHALHRGHDRFAELLPQALDTTLPNTVAAIANRDLLHPGARQFLYDQGVLR